MSLIFDSLFNEHHHSYMILGDSFGLIFLFFLTVEKEINLASWLDLIWLVSEVKSGVFKIQVHVTLIINETRVAGVPCRNPAELKTVKTEH